MTTRVDVSARLELVTNRAAYLEQEKQKLQDEITHLDEEKAILTRLSALYAQHKDDQIDLFRADIFNAPKAKRERRDAKSVVCQALQECAGGGTTKDLQAKTGLTSKQIYSTVYLLKKDGLIADRRGKYILLEK